MKLELEKFVMQDKIKILSKRLLDAESDIKVINLLKEVSSNGELEKARILLKCQKRDIGNNFAALAILISLIAILLPAFSENRIAYIFVSIFIVIVIGRLILRDGLNFINRTNEHNNKIEYILWLIDEEIKNRRDSL